MNEKTKENALKLMPFKYERKRKEEEETHEIRER